MAVALATLLLATLTTAPAEAVAPPRTAVAGGLAKVRPGALPAPSRAVALGAARGECEGVQVVVLPPARAVTATLSPLASGKNTLAIRLYREAFIDVTTPSNTEGETGKWPDALVPVGPDAYAHEPRSGLPADSTAAEPLVLYLEACVPAKAAPGVYRGALTLREAGAKATLESVALQLTVHPFVLPATSSLPNTFGLSLYSMAKGHALPAETPAAQTLLAQYATALLAHRVSAHGLSYEPPPVKWEGDVPRVAFDAYDAEVGPFLEGTVLPSGARFTTTDVRTHRSAGTPERKAAYYRAFADHLREKGWKAQPFYYAKDEPKPKDYPLVVAQSKAVHLAASELPVLITHAPHRALNGSADILCPVLNCFFPRGGAETCANAQPLSSMRSQLGPRAQVWWYQSCMSHGCDGGPVAKPAVEAAFRGWASYMVDLPATRNRAMGALAFLTGIEGELYFDTLHAYTQGDPWKSVFYFGGNGDGTLFYPGTPERFGGLRPFPVESLRLKLIRDGLEDYEYLRLLAAVDGVLARSLARRLARSGYDIESDPAVWDEVRATIAARLSAPSDGGPR